MATLWFDEWDNRKTRRVKAKLAKLKLIPGSTKYLDLFYRWMAA